MRAGFATDGVDDVKWELAITVLAVAGYRGG
jgi:hypothetical protein